ncbi:MAG: ABC transporter permease [Phycisphaeraceae bacterium]|nr:ABC transporter permease [Phycisphaeraceae bacterium]
MTPSASPATESASNLVAATLTLWRREMVRFFRQRNRVVGSLATPLVFWLLLGSGLNRSVSMQAMGATHGYLAYFYPGSVVLMLMFTAIFSTISVIEERRDGFLQGVLAAPTPRLAIVLGKVLGGAAIATTQGLLMLAIWPLVGPWPGLVHMLAALIVMFVLSLALSALGLCMAWPCQSTAGFHAIMNLVLMPMWFLSGAVFPWSGAPPWMQWIMAFNPLTYGQSAFAAALLGEDWNQPLDSCPGGLSMAMVDGATGLFAVALIFLAVVVVARPLRDPLT